MVELTAMTESSLGHTTCGAERMNQIERTNQAASATLQRDLTPFIRVARIAAFVLIMATSLRGQQPPAPSPNQGQPPLSSQENSIAPSPNRNPPTRLSQPGAPTSLPSAPPTNVTPSPFPP